MSSFRCTFSRWLQQNEQKSETPERKSEASHDGSDTDAVEVCEARGGGVSEVTADVSLLGNHTVVSISVFLYFCFGGRASGELRVASDPARTRTYQSSSSQTVEARLHCYPESFGNNPVYKNQNLHLCCPREVMHFILLSYMLIIRFGHISPLSDKCEDFLKIRRKKHSFIYCLSLLLLLSLTEIHHTTCSLTAADG